MNKAAATNVKEEIEEAHKQQMEMMKLVKASASASDRKSRKGGSQRGGFLSKAANNVKEMTTFLTTMVMVYRGKSGEAIDGFVEKYASDGLKKRIEIAGKDAAKFLEVAKAKQAGGSVETRSQSRSNKEQLSEDDIYTGEKNAKGEKHGTGKMEYENGNVYEGQWVDGVRQGKGKITFANKSSYEGTWSNDKIAGRGIYTYFNGNVYDGQLENGVPAGFGKMTYINGDVYDGEWKEGKRYGEGKMLYKNGEKFVGNWKRDKRQGKGALFDLSGNIIIEGEYEDDEAPFDVSNLKTKFSKVDTVIGNVNKTIDETINSPNVKMFREKLEEAKKMLPAVPDLNTLSKYTFWITTIFSYVMYLLTSKQQCTPMDTINPAKDFFFCKLIETGYKLFITTLNTIAGDNQVGFNLFVDASKSFVQTMKWVLGIGLSGSFLLVFYMAWTYINTSHEDHEKVLRDARAASRRKSSSSSSSSSARRTQKRK